MGGVEEVRTKMESRGEQGFTKEEQEVEFWKKLLDEITDNIENSNASSPGFTPFSLIPPDINAVIGASSEHNKPPEITSHLPSCHHLNVKNYTHFFVNGKPVPLDDVHKIKKLEVGEKNFYQIGTEAVIRQSSLLNREYYINDRKLTRKEKMQMHFCPTENGLYLKTEKIVSNNAKKSKKKLSEAILKFDAADERRQKKGQPEYSIVASSSPGMYPALQTNFIQSRQLTHLEQKQRFLPY